MQRSEKRKQRKKQRKRRILFAVIILLLCIIGYGIYVTFDTYHALNETYDDLGREKSDLREAPISINKDPFSILLLGIEDYSSGGKNGRTDAILVATISPEDKTVKLLSIPRDTLVEINEEGRLGKINSAHVFYGKTGTIKTVENFLEIPIDYYATVDFDGFVNIVDILGGVKVNVPFDFSQDSLEGNMYHFYEGEMELDGNEALAFVRMRKQDPEGDIGRNKRQQEVIKGMVDKAFSFSTLTKINDIAETIGENVETNFKISDGLGLLKHFSGFSANQIETVKLETYPDRYNGASVQIVDPESLEDVQTTLKEHLGLVQSNIVQDNANGYKHID